MSHRLALLFLALASVALLAAYVIGGGWAVWTAAILAGLFPVALAMLGALRPGGEERRGAAGWRRGPWAALAVLALLLGGGMAAMVATSGRPAGDGGLPTAGRWLIGALWLGPLVVSVLAYAITFRRSGLGDADLERVRRAAGAGRRGDG